MVWEEMFVVYFKVPAFTRKGSENHIKTSVRVTDNSAEIRT
jgi:hypothetical protein